MAHTNNLGNRRNTHIIRYIPRSRFKYETVRPTPKVGDISDSLSVFNCSMYYNTSKNKLYLYNGQKQKQCLRNTLTWTYLFHWNAWTI